MIYLIEASLISSYLPRLLRLHLLRTCSILEDWRSLRRIFSQLRLSNSHPRCQGMEGNSRSTIWEKKNNKQYNQRVQYKIWIETLKRLAYCWKYGIRGLTFLSEDPTSEGPNEPVWISCFPTWIDRFDWKPVHTRLDRSPFALRKCLHSFRSISVCIEKVFTLV